MYRLHLSLSFCNLFSYIKSNLLSCCNGFLTGEQHMLCTLLCGFLNSDYQFAMTQMTEEEYLPGNTVTGSLSQSTMEE